MWSNISMVTLLLLLIASIKAQDETTTGLSRCLQQCLEPMIKIERTISYIYRNYESVCEVLDKSGKCVEKCSNEDKAKFFQYTTFYRIHCLDFEEELEEHLECLKEASYKADVICRGKCAQKSDDKRSSKADKQKSVCKGVECSTMCFYKEFSQACPCAKDALLRMNVRIVEDSVRLTHPSAIEKLDEQCRRVHDPEYMRKRMLEAAAQGTPEDRKPVTLT